jgi:hypothetical protein
MIWRFVERLGASRADDASWPVGKVDGLSPKVKRSATFLRALSPVVLDAVDDLLDGAVERPKHTGVVLATFPEADRWSIPTRIWHSDTHFLHAPEPLFGVKVYGFINHVGPGQGGTCAISGGHHLVERWRSTHPDESRTKGFLERFLRSDPWLVDLTSGSSDEARTERLTRSTTIDGHDVRVVELTGDPGDVVLTHHWALHCIAPNAAAEPRMMFSRNFWRRGVDQVAQLER